MVGDIISRWFSGIYIHQIERNFLMKKWYESKTIWFNVGTMAVSGLTALAGSAWIAENPIAAAVVTCAIAIVNVFLRKITDEGIE
jgi:hypothetical protein